MQAGSRSVGLDLLVSRGKIGGWSAFRGYSPMPLNAVG